MGKILTIAAHEFIETIKTKSFFLGAVLMPVVLLGLIYGTGWLLDVVEQDKVPPRRIAVVDETGMVFDDFVAGVEQFNKENPQRIFQPEKVAAAPKVEEELANQTRTGDLYAYLVIPPKVISGEAAATLGRKDVQIEAGRQIQRMLSHAVFLVRCKTATPPIDPSRIESLQKQVEVTTIDVATKAAAPANEMARMLTPFAFMFLLWMATLGISQGLLTSVIEEKSSRVMEVLLSAISPTQLMAGKIFGMVLVGMLLLVIWGGSGWASAHARNMEYLVTSYRLTYAVLYFIPGFLLSASMLAAIGSACNTLKDAQGMAFPLSMINIVPMLVWLPISQNPNSTLALVLSFFPPITPFVMILRICADPHTPVWQIVATLAILWASVAFMIWAAGKIFHVGVLMYGKAPTPRELVRWLRYA